VVEKIVTNSSLSSLNGVQLALNFQGMFIPLQGISLQNFGTVGASPEVVAGI
jgi:hypothetical protein